MATGKGSRTPSRQGAVADTMSCSYMIKDTLLSQKVNLLSDDLLQSDKQHEDRRIPRELMLTIIVLRSLMDFYSNPV